MHIKIEDKLIGKDHPCFIIAEVGVNHNGKLDSAKKLVDKAKEAGADAVKFQTFKAEDVVTDNASMADYQIKNTGKKENQLDMLKRYELSFEDFKKLKDYCDKKGIIFLSTPHTESALDFLDGLVPIFKIASGDLTNLPFLEKAAKKGKPIILSTGMSILDEVKEAVNIIKRYNNQLILLHCTTDYPCKEEDVNLKAIKTIEKETGCIAGYSDHTANTITPALANALGAAVIEKHFTLDKNIQGPDHKASLNPEELKEMVEYIRYTEKVLGSKEKKPAKSEEKISKIIRKSIAAAKDIPKGAKISKEMLITKRPSTGIEPRFISRLTGKTAAKDVKKDALISWSDIE